mmetsp:Transcript_8094/g.9437  ORF Transcript_8094/g.9437 Transcript_8094/m.9437 type:complete len:232 (-) Transcript_8094:305-1000(-)
MISLIPFIRTSALMKTKICTCLTTYLANLKGNSFLHPTTRQHLHHHLCCKLHRHLQNRTHTRIQILLRTLTNYHPQPLTISVQFSTVAYSTRMSYLPLTTLSSAITMCHHPPVRSHLTTADDHDATPAPHPLATTPTIHPSSHQLSIVIPTTRTMITTTTPTMHLTTGLMMQLTTPTVHMTTPSTTPLITQPTTTTMHLTIRLVMQPTTPTVHMTTIMMNTPMNNIPAASR